MKLKITVLLMILMSVACHRVPVQKYLYEANLHDPELIFTTETDYPTYFSLNIYDGKTSNCANFQSLGYVFRHKIVPFNIYPKYVPSIETKSPANKLVTVIGKSRDDKVSCTTKYHQFTAELGKTYNILYKLEDRKCYLEITEKMSSKPVNSQALNKCAE